MLDGPPARAPVGLLGIRNEGSACQVRLQEQLVVGQTCRQESVEDIGNAGVPAFPEPVSALGSGMRWCGLPTMGVHRFRARVRALCLCKAPFLRSSGCPSPDVVHGTFQVEAATSGHLMLGTAYTTEGLQEDLF